MVRGQFRGLRGGQEAPPRGRFHDPASDQVQEVFALSLWSCQGGRRWNLAVGRALAADDPRAWGGARERVDRKSTRLNSSHANISYAVFCLKKKKTTHKPHSLQ